MTYKNTFFLFSLVSLLMSGPARADGLIDNVNGITLTQEGKEKRFYAMVIGSNGRVKKLLQRRDRRPADLEYRYDGKGRTLLPGFVDGHAHVIRTGLTALTLDLSDANSMEEAKQKISAYASQNSGKFWIIGRGWNHHRWNLGRFPNAQDLQGLAGDRPIWLLHQDGQAGWANRAAMEAARISGATKTPRAGVILKEAGRPSGIFIDTAMQLVDDIIPKPRPVERDLAFLAAQKMFLSKGVTTVSDMGTSLADWQSYRRAGDTRRLNLRIISYADDIDEMIRIAGPGPSPWVYQDKLRMIGVKLHLDGGLGSGGAWLKKPYIGTQSAGGNNRGRAQLSPAQLRNKLTRGVMDGFQVAVHAVGDQANAELLSAIEDVAPTFGGDRRWRIEHAHLFDAADRQRLSALKAIVSVQPLYQLSGYPSVLAGLSPDQHAHSYAWRSLSQFSASLSFGSDAPGQAINPFAAIAAAMTREDARGQPFGGWQPAERLRREDAWQAHTLNPSFAAFAEDRLGSLEPGKHADFILVDTDIMLATPAELRGIEVLETWVGGKSVYVRK